MSTKAEVKVQLTSEAKMAALTDYSRRTKEAADRTTELRSNMQGLSVMGQRMGSFFVATGLAAAASGAGMLAAARSASTLATEIARSAGRVGISAEGYQVFGQILKAAGGSAADLTVALSTLRNMLGEAIAAPEGAPAKALGALSLTAESLSKLKPEEQLERISKALAGIVDPSRRAALAQDLLGRGATNLNPLLGRLATDGYANLRSEVEMTAGLLSNDMAQALDDVANRTQAASNRAAVALAPFQLKVEETKAGIAEMFADLASTNLSGAAFGIGTAAAGIGAVGIGAAAAGGLGSASAWGMVAGASIAKAAAMQAPVWASIGVMIAAAIGAALAIKGLEAWRLNAHEERDQDLAYPIDRANSLRETLLRSRDPAMLGRVQKEAERLSASTFRQAQETDDDELRVNLLSAARTYAGLVAHAREHGQEIIQANLALDAQNEKQATADQLAQAQAAREREAAAWLEKRSAAMTEQIDLQRRKLALTEMEPAARLLELERERAEVQAASAVADATASERRRHELETALKLVGLDQEIAAARRAIAADTAQAAADAERSAAAAERERESQRRAAADALERTAESQFSSVQAQDARDQASFNLTAVEKRRRRLEALGVQQGIASTSAAALRDSGNPEAARRFDDRAAQTGADIAAIQAGTPETATEGLTGGLTRIQDQWGTLAEQMQTSVASIGQSISTSIGGGLQQVLGTTEFWSQKLGMIGGPIMGGITASVSRMFGEWIAGRAAMAAKNIVLSMKENAAAAPGALFASIKSFGAAAAVGAAAFLAAKALGGGFFEGGFTGLGDPHEVAGVVHKNEFVIPHDVTSAVGPGALAGMVEAVRNPSQSFEMSSALTAGASAGGLGLPVVGGGGSATTPQRESRTLIVDYREQDMIERLVSDPRFNTAVRRIGRRHTGDFGAGT